MDKKKLIQEILPDLVELLANKLDQIEELNKKPVKKKAATKKKAPVKKKPVKKAATKKKPVKKAAAKKSVKQEEKRIPVREDFAGENTFVDDLSVASEFIETDKLICKKHQRNVEPQESLLKIKQCGFTTDEKGNIVNVGGCGKQFESYEGYGYLCDSCLTGNINASR